ncbi:MAG: hypothetical protein M3Z56_02070, partial [Bacteroidota bacterium]|nr:hypothetical protein [Bacteroidota bacterium]
TSHNREKIPEQFIIPVTKPAVDGKHLTRPGRVAIFNLLPFSLEEIRHMNFALPNYEDYILKGFYPRIYDEQTQCYQLAPGLPQNLR